MIYFLFIIKIINKFIINVYSKKFAIYIIFVTFIKSKSSLLRRNHFIITRELDNDHHINFNRFSLVKEIKIKNKILI